MATREPEEQRADLPFDNEEFSTWFDDYSRRFLMPARIEAVRALHELLDGELSEPQRVRVRVREGRVKTKARTWQKLNDRYADQLSSTADVPRVVDDLVGLRIVCTNQSDLDRVVEILEAIDDYLDGSDPVLATIPGSVKDWLKDPKDSGYRAYHVNLCTSVARATERHVVVCELQVRTLLQDSWGELTHEDTYKPGGYVPDLVQTLSRRMADLMATLDDIAQDLRAELDLRQEVGVEEAPPGAAPDQRENANLEAAKRYLAERVNELERPIDFASLAWELQREFGQEIVDGWLGHETFKNLLRAAVPDARVSPQPPSYVLPSGFDIASYRRGRDVPRAVALLNDADRSFPLVETDHWPRLYAALAEATERVPWTGRPDIRTVNELTRAARDATAATGEARVTRGQAAYVAKALLFAGKLEPQLDATAVESIFVTWTVERAAGLGLPQEDLRELEAWLRGTWVAGQD